MKAAGFDTESVASLKEALDSPNVGVQLGAIYLLGEMQAVEATPELGKAIDSSWPMVSLAACEALASMGMPADEWKSRCKRHLDSSDVLIQLRVAGLLAGSGDSSGWPLVAQNLSAENLSYVQTAASVVDRFVGLSTEEGEEIEPLDQVLEAFSTGDEQRRQTLVPAIRRLATKGDVGRIKDLLSTVESEYTRASLESVIQELDRKDS